jgi:hypothetical protein
MNLDLVSSYLLDVSWFFLTSWMIFIVLACMFEFRHDQL